MERQPILYIEDEPDYQVLVSRLLNDAGFAVECADTAAQGLEKLSRMRPSLILLDINLPDASGFELCGRIRQEEAWAEIPVIMLTVRRRPEEWLKGFSKGADDYLSKPYNPPELVERVLSILGGRPRPDASDPEYRLIQAARAGNRSAFEVLIAQYHQPLLHGIRRRADNPAVAEDIVSAAFARAFEKLEGFKGDSSFFTWLYSIAENEMRLHWRDNARATLVEFNDDHPPHQPSNATSSLEDPEMRQKAVRKLYKAITTLPEDFRKPLRRHCLHGVPMNELAMELQVPLGTVLSRIQRGKILLRKIFEGYPRPTSL